MPVAQWCDIPPQLGHAEAALRQRMLWQEECRSHSSEPRLLGVVRIFFPSDLFLRRYYSEAIPNSELVAVVLPKLLMNGVTEGAVGLI